MKTEELQVIKNSMEGKLSKALSLGIMSTKHQKNRKMMFWDKKEEKKLINIKNLTPKHLRIIKRIILSNPEIKIWQGFTSGQWIDSIKEEQKFRNLQVNYVLNSMINKVPKRNKDLIKNIQSLILK